MGERELLEYAAKAARVDTYELDDGSIDFSIDPNGKVYGVRTIGGSIWNPLKNDGDAIRLAAALDLEYIIDRLPGTGSMQNPGDPVRVRVWGLGWHKVEVGTLSDPDVLSAIKMCLVLAAARIGKSMP